MTLHKSKICGKGDINWLQGEEKIYNVTIIMGLDSQRLVIQQIKKAAQIKFLHRALFTLRLKMEFGVCKKFPIFYFCNLVCIWDKQNFLYNEKCQLKEL